MMKRKISPKIMGLILALMIFLAFGNVVSAFNAGDTVEVYNTGSSGLLVLDASCGNVSGGKFDGDRGVVLDGPVYCSNYNRWLIKWSDGLEGWSAEDWLEKVKTGPSPPTTITTLNQPPNSPQTELITVSIDGQSAIPKEVKVGESSTLKFSFTNTGNIPWTFYAAVSLRKPNGDEVNLPTKPVTLSPNQQGSAEWTYTVDTAGNWDVVFGVWKEVEQENSLGHTGWLDGYY